MSGKTEFFRNRYENGIKYNQLSDTLSNGGVIYNSKLEGENYGWTRSSSILFWFSRSGCTCKNGKINKNFERKGNLGSGLQGRVIYCSKTLCNS